MLPGFSQKTLLINLNLITGIDFQPQEYLYFGSEKFGYLRTLTDSDGISGGILPHFGPYIASGIMHDGAFRGRLEQQQADGTWMVIGLKDTNDGNANALIEECLKAEGCSWLERTIIYYTLQLFGWKAFDDDRHDLSSKPSEADLAALIKPKN